MTDAYRKYVQFQGALSAVTMQTQNSNRVCIKKCMLLCKKKASCEKLTNTLSWAEAFD